jgi:hypothetical protein
MVKDFKSWLQENHALVFFLIAQGLALGATLVSLIAYSVRLETRVSTLEIRGSPHLEKIENRLTSLESQSQSNKDSIERIKDRLLK